ncbi:DoxX family membrane protein [uncultured Cyclobacterium sp.]|uniref:DoxX family membrane protein n=1 Tax=uncultured Cyclobacterium sp. TaxID=453820 RepID=UPI0030ED5BE3|tara:strand:+ start:11554 stop:11931 length:378 start_codon:yes stop_codon:yes gene_type:complete
MKIATIIVRVLLGALFLISSVTYFLNLVPQPELTGAMKTFNEGLDASFYLMPSVKVIELVCGIAFISGRFVPLASVLIFPIVVNIVGVHVFLAPEGLPVAIFVLTANLFLAYRKRDHYKGLFSIN